MILLVIITFLLSSQPSAAAPTPSSLTDRLALLSFKSLITSDPSGALASWGNDSLPLCQWPGVTCGGRLHPDRVRSLILAYLDLAGPLSPHLANLTFLRRLRIAGNSLRGPIPPELGRLSRLRILNLSMNYLDGDIPASLTQCSNLRTLSLRDNLLTGEIPRDIGSLSKLQLLNLGENNLTGSIPPSIGNISSLIYLFLHDNSLAGTIPWSVGNLASLDTMQVRGNMLSGSIPPSLYNLSSLSVMVLSNNSLVGTLSPDIFNALPNLFRLLLYTNQLEGPIPASLSNASNIGELDLMENNFSGTIPANLGNLPSLYWLDLGQNQLEARKPSDWDFLTSLTNCSFLKVIQIQSNRLGGVLPNSIGNLSPVLQIFLMDSNQITGSIPDVVGNLGNLTVFSMDDNRLTGVIPPTIGRLQQLNLLSLSRNRLTGPIPTSIGNLNQLVRLHLAGNNLNGSIPASFGDLKGLQELDLSRNMLTGAIPKELVSLRSLATYADLSHNLLTGSLPVEVNKLTNLNELNISYNRLSGKIPSSLGDCQSLEYLDLQGNFFQGTIPQALSNLKGLRELDLSRNNLSGEIPEFLERLGGLQHLNLSFNNLEGGVPSGGIFRNMTEILVLGNKLCGGSPEFHLPPCSSKSTKNRQKNLLLKVIVPVFCVALCLIIVLAILAALRRMRNSRKKPSFTSPIEGQFVKVSYAELLKSTNGFSPSNLLGVGSVGSVYKGTMASSESIVAVKVLNLQQQGAWKSFIAECEVLRNIRHRNLIKILTICSSVDFKGNDFKALVLEFMPNGSLDKWLHPVASEHSDPGNLSLIQRLNIANDVASALEYLHLHGGTPIVHCDLKPNNVLLDVDMCAHVGDFGLARFLSEKPDEYQTRSIGIKGTIGYVPPEYGMGGQASTRGDVYSFGILLLELFTGRRPTDEMFCSGLSIHNHVKMAFPERLMGIVDPRLLSSNDDREPQGNNQNRNDAECTCLASVLRIGLSCSEEDPRERMVMEDITKELHAVRDMLLKFQDA